LNDEYCRIAPFANGNNRNSNQIKLKSRPSLYIILASNIDLLPPAARRPIQFRDVYRAIHDEIQKQPQLRKMLSRKNKTLFSADLALIGLSIR